MKLLIVAAIKEYSQPIADIFKKSSIPVFSILDSIGVKNFIDTDLKDDWFSRGVGEFESVFMVSFTSDAQIDMAFKAFELFNNEKAGDFPVRAFVLPVEKSLN